MGDRVIVTLACTDCKRKNYIFQRGKKKEYKVERRKFCEACGKHTAHKETKSS